MSHEANKKELVEKAREQEFAVRQRQCNLSVWARQWHDGDARCPSCDLSDFDLVDVSCEGNLRYEIIGCQSCGTRWKIEFREAAIIVLGSDAISLGDWINF